MAYDKENIFAKVLREEIPCKKIYENEYALAFYDIAPQAPVHALVIPKGAYINQSDFTLRATEKEIAGFHRVIAKVAEDLGLSENGYRLIANSGPHGGQEVEHYHMHILGGKELGAMLPDG